MLRDYSFAQYFNRLKMKIAFYKGSPTIRDWAIRLVTRSPYSRCIILFDDGLYASAFPREGVTFKETDKLDLSGWDVYELTVSSVQVAGAQAMFNIYEGHPYPHVGALLAWLSVDSALTASTICGLACGLTCSIRSPGHLFMILQENALI